MNLQSKYRKEIGFANFRNDHVFRICYTLGILVRETIMIDLRLQLHEVCSKKNIKKKKEKITYIGGCYHNLKSRKF